jgi:hypothetical protein
MCLQYGYDLTSILAITLLDKNIPSDAPDGDENIVGTIDFSKRMMSS